jgi:hypothetical protein
MKKMPSQSLRSASWRVSIVIAGFDVSPAQRVVRSAGGQRVTGLRSAQNATAPIV